ncbi:MAG: hypothetical protein SPI65_01885 [Peptoniphilus sp.]|nr:CD1247 N-terminal domain-containing protein [Peptoniphilus sp.]MDD7363851.1 hypothetical protein [Bacillota bacterium]MDY6044310.1 hypothetical protein [Peptoniphilus sp.]
MKNILQRIAYVQGLADGLGLEDNSKEGQILLELVDVVSELAEVVDEKFEDLEDYIDVVEEDLTELEGYTYDDDLYGDYDDFDLDDYDFYDDFNDPTDIDVEYEDIDALTDEEE